MGKLSKMMGMMKGDDSLPDETESGDDSAEVESGEEAGPADAEVLAMKQFERAGTPEKKAAALKDFLEACGCSMSGD